MDTEAREYFTRVEHYLFQDLILGLDYNRQERLVHQVEREDIDRVDIDLTWQRTDSLRIETGYRYETIDFPNQAGADDQDNHIFWMFVNYSFDVCKLQFLTKLARKDVKRERRERVNTKGGIMKKKAHNFYPIRLKADLGNFFIDRTSCDSIGSCVFADDLDDLKCNHGPS
jgi:hypothetical protein